MADELATIASRNALSRELRLKEMSMVEYTGQTTQTELQVRQALSQVPEQQKPGPKHQDLFLQHVRPRWTALKVSWAAFWRV